MAASGFTPIQLYYSTTATNVPLAANLVAGELAINTADGKLYYKNVSGVVTLLAGLSGFSGTSGFSGASGFSGFSGSGISGFSGISGLNGVSGFSGATGTSGFSGASGTSGFSGLGVSGFSGFSGISGFSGATGAGGSGTSGTSGYSGFSGYSGTNGSVGTSGFSGYSGATGANGTTGTSGFSGVAGASGFSGYSGATGPTAYPTTGIAVSTGSAWGTSLAVPVQVSSGGTGLTALTAGFIPFGNSATQLGSSSLLNWSTANVRLGVGIASPVATLHVRGGNSNNAIIDNDGSQFTTMSWYNNGTVRAQGYYDASNLLFVFGTDVAAPLIFKANGTEGMRLSSGGGVSIGTATGAGANNLLVNGTITGAGTGLTGTASSLSIGGSAASLSATLAVASGGTGITSAGTAGNVLTSNGTNFVSSAPTFTGANSQVFTASGTFTIPAGVSAIKVTLVGGGGGGGGYRSACSNTAGSGGGSAASSVQYFTGLTPLNTLTVTVGAAGTLATNGNTPTNGGAGGTSSIASGTQTITTASANGGGAGIAAGGFGNAATAGAGGAASSSGVAYSIAGLAGFLPSQVGCSWNLGGLGARSAQAWGEAGRTVGVAATGFGSSGSGGGFVDAAGNNIATISTVGRIGIVIVEW